MPPSAATWSALLDRLAGRAARAGAMVEVNEKWSCPSVRTLAAMARAGVPVVVGSDSQRQVIGTAPRVIALPAHLLLPRPVRP